jgi:hypothetical protein
MNINDKHQPESSMSIPIYEGSMVSLRNDSRGNGSVRYKSAISTPGPNSPAPK